MIEKILTAIVLKILDILLKKGVEEYLDQKEKTIKEIEVEQVLLRLKNAKSKKERTQAAIDLLNIK